jgi:hypothetical protein
MINANDSDTAGTTPYTDDPRTVTQKYNTFFKNAERIIKHAR